MLDRETLHKFVGDRVGAGADFFLSLILDWVRDVNRVQIRASEGRSLRASSSREHVRRYGYAGDSEAFKASRVVQTARCARSSISQRFDHRLNIGVADPVDDFRRRRLSESRLGLADHGRDPVGFLEDRL